MLGAILLNVGAARLALDLLSTPDFFRHAHRLIYASMARVHEDSAIDFLTVKHDLEQHGELDAVGGPAYLSSLVDGVPTSTNVEHYAGILKEMRRRRDLIGYGTKVTELAYDGNNTSQETLQQADRWLLDLAGTATGDDALEPQAAVVGPFLESVMYRAEHRHELLGLSTGLPSLDDLTCGLEPGDLTIVAASTGGGKTQLALQVAKTSAGGGHVTVYNSLEMQRGQLLQRLAASEAGIELWKVRRGYLSADELGRLANAMSATAGWPLYINDAPGMTIQQIRAKARRIAALAPVKLVVIDYLQLVTGSGHENRATEVGEIGRGAKLLARELGCHVLALSQLNREHAKEKRRPRLSDLRESGALEQHADLVHFLYTDETKTPITTELIVGKQRQGPQGTVDLTWDKPTGRFTDLEAAKSQPRQADVFPAEG